MINLWELFFGWRSNLVVLIVVVGFAFLYISNKISVCPCCGEKLGVLRFRLSESKWAYFLCINDNCSVKYISAKRLFTNNNFGGNGGLR